MCLASGWRKPNRYWTNQARSDRDAARKRYEEAKVFTNYKQSNRAVMMIKNKRRRVSFVNESQRFKL
jgi:hypothetical protein